MDLVQCRALLASLQNYGVTSGSGDDALHVWHTITDLVKTTCDTAEDRAVAASLMFDAELGALRFCRSSIAAQGAQSCGCNAPCCSCCNGAPCIGLHCGGLRYRSCKRSTFQHAEDDTR